MNTKIADQIMSEAKKDQELRFQLYDTKDEAELWKKIEAQDELTTKMMQDIIAQIGWPTISKVGKKASHAAWLLVQHADKYPKFQAQCLTLMKKEPKDDIKQANIAFLEDRVRMAQKRKQLYGTQFVPVNKKDNPNFKDIRKFEPYQIEDIANVEKRRKSMGLNTLKENTAEINEMKPQGTKQSGLD